MTIKTSSAKAKGRELQKYVRDKILDRFPWLKEGDVESRSMGASGVDIMLSPLARKTFPLSIECKKTKKTPSRAEMKQARANTYKESDVWGKSFPAIVWAPHGCGPEKSMIIFDFNDFLDFYDQVSEEMLIRRAIDEAERRK